jgi:hypothetical protein
MTCRILPGEEEMLYDNRYHWLKLQSAHQTCIIPEIIARDW